MTVTQGIDPAMGGGRPLGLVREMHATLAAIVAEDPLTAWLIPFPAARSVFGDAYSALLHEYAAEHGDVHVTDDGLGVLVWYTFDVPALAQERKVRGDAALVAAALRAVQADCMVGRSVTLEDVYVRLDDLYAGLSCLRPVVAHHQVAFIGVHPSARRRGVATGLLDFHAAHLDAAGSAAYAVATSAAGRDLLTRHGYHLSSPAVHLLDGPPLWPMWRPPNPRQRVQQLERISGTASADGGRPEWTTTA
jgi:GNAT superfamily N-acetyltransferase